jgi:hypothetical protein
VSGGGGEDPAVAVVRETREPSPIPSVTTAPQPSTAARAAATSDGAAPVADWGKVWARELARPSSRGKTILGAARTGVTASSASREPGRRSPNRRRWAKRWTRWPREQDRSTPPPGAEKANRLVARMLLASPVSAALKASAPDDRGAGEIRAPAEPTTDLLDANDVRDGAAYVRDAPTNVGDPGRRASIRRRRARPTRPTSSRNISTSSSARAWSRVSPMGRYQRDGRCSPSAPPEVGHGRVDALQLPPISASGGLERVQLGREPGLVRRERGRERFALRRRGSSVGAVRCWAVADPDRADLGQRRLLGRRQRPPALVERARAAGPRPPPAVAPSPTPSASSVSRSGSPRPGTVLPLSQSPIAPCRRRPGGPAPPGSASRRRSSRSQEAKDSSDSIATPPASTSPSPPMSRRNRPSNPPPDAAGAGDPGASGDAPRGLPGVPSARTRTSLGGRHPVRIRAGRPGGRGPSPAQRRRRRGGDHLLGHGPQDRLIASWTRGEDASRTSTLVGSGESSP